MTLMQTVVVTFVEALAGVIVVDSDAVVDSAAADVVVVVVVVVVAVAGEAARCGWGVELGFGFIFGITLAALFFI